MKVAEILHFPFLETKERHRRKINAQVVGWTALIILIFTSATHPSFAKQLTASFTPLSLLFIGESLIFLFNTLSFGIVPIMKKIIRLKKEQYIPLLTFGLCCGVIGPFLWLSGLKETTAINSELFGKTELLFMVIFSIFLLHERFKRVHLLAGSIIVAGIVIVALRGFTKGMEFHAGDAMILASSLAFSIGVITMKKNLSKLEPQVILFARNTCAIVAFFAMSLFVKHTFMDELRSLPIHMIWVLVGYGFIARFLSLYAFYEAMERLQASIVSIALTLNIVFGLSFAHLYLGEALLWYHILGCSLIILGALMMKFSRTHPMQKQIKLHLHARDQHHAQ